MKRTIEELNRLTDRIVGNLQATIEDLRQVETTDEAENFTMAHFEEAERQIDTMKEGIFEHFDDIQDELREQFSEMMGDQWQGDDIALNEAFNNWTDALCKDGEISPEVFDRVTRTDN